jgi:hypothetical protein
LNGFIPAFADSKSYDIAGQNAAILVDAGPLTTIQAKQVLKAIKERDQIYQSRSARRYVLTLLKKYGHVHPGLASQARQALK